MGVLSNSFFDRDVVTVARDLIGKQLCRRSREGLACGVIIETEAYLAEGDSAAHSFKGINRKNASMFGPSGRAYVYTIHARQCFNVVTEGVGVGSAVLIRALEPTVGLPLMHERRRTDRIRDLCRGPARLCEALSIGRDLNAWHLSQQRRLWIDESTDGHPSAIANSVRIGVTSAEGLPLRFFVPQSEFISGSRTLNASGSD